MLVLEADDDAVLRGLIGERAQSRDHTIEARIRIHCAPVGEDANNLRASAFGDLERARGEPRLVGEGVLGREHILLETRIHVGRIRQHALQQRRGDGDNLQARVLHDPDRAI